MLQNPLIDFYGITTLRHDHTQVQVAEAKPKRELCIQIIYDVVEKYFSSVDLCNMYLLIFNALILFCAQ